MIMHTQSGKFIIVCGILVIGLISCTTSQATPLLPTETATPQPPTSTPTPLPPTVTPTLPPVCQSLEIQDTPSEFKASDVVSEMVVGLNTGDISKAMSFFAEDARIYIFGVPPNGFQSIIGKEEICRFLADYASNNAEWEINIFSSVNSSGGVFLTARSKIWLDVYRELEVAPFQFFEKYFVVDGKIVEYSSWMQEESLAKLRPVLAEILSPKPDTSSEIPGSEITVVFSDKTCVYEGPVVWKSGDIDFTIEVIDQKDVLTGFVLINLDEGYDIFDLAVATAFGRPMWVRYTDIFDSQYWDTETAQHNVTGSPKYLMCFGGELNSLIGLLGPFEVKP